MFSLRFFVFTGSPSVASCFAICLALTLLSSCASTTDNRPAGKSRATKPAQSSQATSAQAEERLARLRKITANVDEGQRDDAALLLDSHLQRYPDDADAYGQLARISMQNGVISDNTLFGYRFTNEADRKAFAALQTALKLQPDNSEERSRLGYLHAVQGRYAEANIAFARVRQSGDTPIWLGYNEAIVAVGQGEYDKAAMLLEPVTSKRPSGQSSIRHWTLYRTAWRLRKSLALEHPDTDPVPAIRAGKLRRLPIEALNELGSKFTTSEKLIMIILSSSDTACAPCVASTNQIDEFIDALQDYYEFFYASVEPWDDIGKQQSLIQNLKIRGLPYHVFIHNGQVLSSNFGVPRVASIPSLLEKGRELLNKQ